MCVGVYVYVCCMSTFSNSFSSETIGPIEAKYHMAPPWDGGMKVYSNGPGHMTKMAAMPIYGKNLKNLLFWSQKADDLETWYTAFCARVLPSSFKWWPWVDLDLFYGKVKFVPLCFCMGKRWNDGFFRTYCRLWFKISYRWPNVTRRFCWHQHFVPWGGGAVCPLPWDYMHVLNHEKSCIRSDFKEISLKLATNW